MKSLFTYLFIVCCIHQMFSQVFADYKIIDEAVITDFLIEERDDSEAIIRLFEVNDVFTLQLIDYSHKDLSFGFNTRLEEELPYEASRYDFKGFYYLDFSLSYDVGSFSFGASLENILNLRSKDFSIDPNLETSNGIIKAFYLSHEADALVSLTINYNF